MNHVVTDLMTLIDIELKYKLKFLIDGPKIPMTDDAGSACHYINLQILGQARNDQRVIVTLYYYGPEI